MTETTELATEPTTLPVIVKRMEAIEPLDTQDDICSAIMALDYAKEQIRLAETAMKTNVQFWMETNQVKEFYIGTVKFYLGTDKETKCLSVRNTIEALLELAGGDVDGVCDCLSTNAIKHGAAKKKLSPEKYAELFETKEKTKLHVEGAKAARTLQTTDTKFLK